MRLEHISQVADAAAEVCVYQASQGLPMRQDIETFTRVITAIQAQWSFRLNREQEAVVRAVVRAFTAGAAFAVGNVKGARAMLTP